VYSRSSFLTVRICTRANTLHWHASGPAELAHNCRSHNEHASNGAGWPAIFRVRSCILKVCNQNTQFLLRDQFLLQGIDPSPETGRRTSNVHRSNSTAIHTWTPELTSVYRHLHFSNNVYAIKTRTMFMMTVGYCQGAHAWHRARPRHRAYHSNAKRYR